MLSYYQSYLTKNYKSGKDIKMKKDYKAEDFYCEQCKNKENELCDRCEIIKQEYQKYNDKIAKKQSININGKSLQQIADETGISYNTLYVRYKRNGHKLDEIKPKKNYQFKDKEIITPEILAIIKERNLDYNVVYKRLENGWDIERALNTDVNRFNEIKKIAQDNNINYGLLLSKINKGLSVEQAVEKILKNKNKKKLQKMTLNEIYQLNKDKQNNGDIHSEEIV